MKGSLKALLKGIIHNRQLDIFLLSTIASLSSFLFYFLKGLTLQYNDATSHLDISRRIVDSMTPGVVQIGSNWLPLLHLLELPLITNYYLWQTGIAGSIISMASFIISSLLIFKTTKYITGNDNASAIGSLSFITNGNMLYMQTTAMFEPLLIVTSITSIYFLIRWSSENKLDLLILSAFFVFLTTMTRYDGWFLLLSSCLFVFSVSFLKKGYTIAEGNTILFSSLSSLGVFLWLIYNKLIFGSAFYFMSGEFSARAQQIDWQKIGKLPAWHNVFISVWTYSAAVVYNTGIFGIIVGGIGLIYFLTRKYDFSVKLDTLCQDPRSSRI